MSAVSSFDLKDGPKFRADARVWPENASEVATFSIMISDAKEEMANRFLFSGALPPSQLLFERAALDPKRCSLAACDVSKLVDEVAMVRGGERGTMRRRWEVITPAHLVVVLFLVNEGDLEMAGDDCHCQVIEW